MKQTSDDGPRRAAMPPDICCNQFRALLAVIDEHYGRAGVDNLLTGLVDSHRFLVADRHHPARLVPITRERLADPAVWVSNEFSLQLLANVRSVVVRPRPFAWTAEQCVRHHLSKSTLFVANVVSPETVARQAARINAKFNRTKSVEVKNASPTGATFVLQYRPGIRVTKDVCEWNLGVYAAIARAAGTRDVSARELACVTDGADACVLRFDWKTPTLTARLGRQVRAAVAEELLADYEATLQDRDRLIDTLRESEERYRTLTDHSLTGIYICDQGQILYVNPALAHMLGTTEQELVGRMLGDLAQPEERERVHDLTSSLIRAPGSPSAHFEFRALHGLGYTIPLEVLSTNIDYLGRTASLGNVIDVSDRHRAREERLTMEARLHQAQKMEAVGRLAAGVAHDFNNLLTCILGATEIIRMRCGSDDGLAEAVSWITDASTRAAALTRQLLAFSRHKPASARPVDLNEIVGDMQRMLERIIGEHIEFEVSCGRVPLVLADPTQVEQVILNLAVNARDAMPDGGRLTIETDAVTVHDADSWSARGVPSGTYALLRVSDSGEGIHSDIVPHIFDPFFTTRAHGQGTGLGLSTVRAAVVDAGGYVLVHSAPSAGAAFEILLPRCDDAPLPQARSPRRSQDLRGSETVLLVDDDPLVFDVVRRGLVTFGYAVLDAKSGDQAVRLCRSFAGRIDALVSDVVMPLVGGRELAARIREIRPEVRVLLISGYPDTDIGREGWPEEGIALLRKPFSPHQLAEKLREILPPPASGAH